MSESKHTKGKLRILESDQYFLIYKDKHLVARVVDRETADLFAAAPETKAQRDELLESLKEIFDLLEEELPIWYLRGHYNRMKSAIAKAEGK